MRGLQAAATVGVCVSALLMACGSGDDASTPDASAEGGGFDAAADAFDAGTEAAAVDVGVDRYVAPDPPGARMATVDYMGGALLTSAKIITVTFAGDDATVVKNVQDFDDGVTQTQWWTDATAEYCVQPQGGPCIGPGSGGGHVVLNEAAPTSLVDTDSGKGSTVVDFIQKHITSGDLPPPDDQTIYMLYFPSSTTISFDGSKSCQNYGAYHYSATFDLGDAGTQEGAYAVEPRCNYTSYLFFAASHELIEAATDAHPGKDRGYVMQDTSWQWYGDEVGDLCDHPWGFDGTDAGGHNVQRGWSNVSALGGHDPCVTAPTDPYFNVAPGTGKQNLYLAVGETATIDLQPFADGKTGDWSLAVNETSKRYGDKADVLSFQLDTTTVNDGTPAHLQITLNAKPTYGYATYELVSKGNGHEHHWGANVWLK